MPKGAVKSKRVPFSKLKLGGRFRMEDAGGAAALMKVSETEYLHETSGLIYSFTQLRNSLDAEVWRIADRDAGEAALRITIRSLEGTLKVRREQAENHRAGALGRIGVPWPPFYLTYFESVTEEIEEIVSSLKADKEQFYDD